jgi:hypothetical protein
MLRSCSVEGCANPYYARGLCNKHIIRLRKYRSVDGGRGHHGTPQERFWRRVSKAGPDDCWLWDGPPCRGGYGSFQVGGKGGKTLLAHRFACEDAHGPAPEKHLAMHSCDVPLCCNPAHLRWGTPKENMQDMHQKGRASKITPKGEEHFRAVLNEDLVRYIRSCPEKTHAALARELSVATSTVRYVRSGRGWRHVT